MSAPTLERIARIDPQLHSVIAVDPTAIDQARRVDAGGLRGPLAGQPVLIKDNIESAGPLPTTAGQPRAREQCHQPRCPAGRAAARGGRGDRRQDQPFGMGEHPLQQLDFRLERGRRRGLTIPGRSTATPADPRAGRGAAVAAGLVRFAIGTETDGSVTCPASINGIVGLKPTVGLVSRTHVVPISHTQDTRRADDRDGARSRRVADRHRRQRSGRPGDRAKPTSTSATMPPGSMPIRSRASGSA